MNEAHNSNPPIGIILAGGLSSRMGTDKALLKRNGVTMLEHCEQLLKQAGITQILISRNNGSGIADIIQNSGPLGGIYSVIKPLPSGTAVVILPVDMPLLAADDLSLLIQIGQQSNQMIFFDDCYLPLYLPVDESVKAYLHEQLHNDGNRSVKGLIKHFTWQSLAVNDSQKLTNTNTPQQWQQTQALG
ncbi:MAG: molybdopterin-guanine dinucleotide biosynthesis protein A [Alteromonadaceae bacterium]|jgi:molybdopterin-guanine dinucleotide biosynthesis protein A